MCEIKGSVSVVSLKMAHAVLDSITFRKSKKT